MPESHFLHATGFASEWLHLCLLLSVLIDPPQDTSMEAPSSALRAKANPSLCDEHGDLGVLWCFCLPWGASPAPCSYFYKDRTQDPPHRCQTPRAFARDVISCCHHLEILHNFCFSNTTVQKHQFFGTQLSSQSNSHPNPSQNQGLFQ